MEVAADGFLEDGVPLEAACGVVGVKRVASETLLGVRMPEEAIAVLVLVLVAPGSALSRNKRYHSTKTGRS